jgi:glucose dehydrogenase
MPGYNTVQSYENRFSRADHGSGVFSAQTTTNFVPVTDGMLEKPDPGDWLMWRRTLDGWGYSPLNEINKQNVARLKRVWKWEMTPGVQEGTPLVYRGTMYLPNPADVTQAINAATGDLIWEYRRPLPDDLTQYLSGSPLKNRNFAIYDDKIIDLGADDFVYALDARTGKPAWNTRIRIIANCPPFRVRGRSSRKGRFFRAGPAIIGIPVMAALSPHTTRKREKSCVALPHDSEAG